MIVEPSKRLIWEGVHSKEHIYHSYSQQHSIIYDIFLNISDDTDIFGTVTG